MADSLETQQAGEKRGEECAFSVWASEAGVEGASESAQEKKGSKRHEEERGRAEDDSTPGGAQRQAKGARDGIEDPTPDWVRHERAAMRGITKADMGRSADVARTLMCMGICGGEREEISERATAEEGGGSGRRREQKNTRNGRSEWIEEERDEEERGETHAVRGTRVKDASEGGATDGDMKGLTTRERTAGRNGAEREEEGNGGEETKGGEMGMGGNDGDAEGEGGGAAWMAGAGGGKQGGGEAGEGAGARPKYRIPKAVDVAVGIEVNAKGMRVEEADATARAEEAMDAMMQGMRHHVQGRAGTMTEDEIWMGLKRGEIACGAKSRGVNEKGGMGHTMTVISIFKGAGWHNELQFTKGMKAFQTAVHGEVFGMLVTGEIKLADALHDDEKWEYVSVARAIERQKWVAGAAGMVGWRGEEGGERAKATSQREQQAGRGHVSWEGGGREIEGAKGTREKQRDGGRQQGSEGRMADRRREEERSEAKSAQRGEEQREGRGEVRNEQGVQYPRSQTWAEYGGSIGDSQAVSQREQPLLLRHIGDKGARKPQGTDWLSNVAETRFYSTQWADGEVASAENFLQMGKAASMGNKDVAWRIRNIGSGIGAKQAGGYNGMMRMGSMDVERWDGVKEGAMRAIQLEKFMGHKQARAELLATGEREIMEASLDKSWGVGYERESIIKYDYGRRMPAGQKMGANLQGKCLMAVRDSVRETLAKGEMQKGGGYGGSMKANAFEEWAFTIGGVVDGRTQWYGPVPWEIMEKGLLSLGRFRREATWRPWIKGLSGKIDEILGRQELKRTDRAVSVWLQQAKADEKEEQEKREREKKAEAGVGASRKRAEGGGRKREGRAGGAWGRARQRIALMMLLACSSLTPYAGAQGNCTVTRTDDANRQEAGSCRQTGRDGTRAKGWNESTQPRAAISNWNWNGALLGNGEDWGHSMEAGGGGRSRAGEAGGTGAGMETGEGGSGGEAEEAGNDGTFAGEEGERGGERGKGANRGDALIIAGERGKTVTETEHVLRNIRIVAVNVHSFALKQRTEGSGVTEGPRALRKNWNQYLESILDLMKVTNGDGSKSTQLFILASTQLRDQSEITIVKSIIASPPHGYECDETHGVPGTRSRKEIAGVMLCWDPNSLYSMRTGTVTEKDGSTRDTHRGVVVKGRALHKKFGILGGGNARGEADFDCIGVYMPPRGGGAKGRGVPELDAEIARSFARVQRITTQLAARGALLLAGDFNAEPNAALRMRRGGEGSTATPSDVAMDHLLDSIPIVRIHELDEGGWTYTNKNKGNRYYTWIDHMYANTGFRRGVHTMSVADNMVETGTQRHRGLVIEYRVDMGVREGWGEERRKTAKVCRGTVRLKSYRDCRRIYEERQGINMRELKPRLESGQLNAGEQILAIQNALAEAMELAVDGIEAGDKAGERSKRKREETRDNKGKRRKGQSGGQERAVAAEDKGKAWAVARLNKRLQQIEDAPTTMEEWKEFVPDTMRTGLPV